MAQTDTSVPGGATGANVYCLQAGDLTSGTFVGTFLQTGPGAWEERLRAGVFKLEERKRDDLMVELFDGQRSATVQFDFVNKTIKYKPANSTAASGTDRYHMLNATDQPSSEDCVSVASAGGPGDQAGAGGGGGSGPGAGGGGGPGGRGGPGGGGGGGGGGASGPGMSPVQTTSVPPRTIIVIPPGTQLTHVQGPPCPGNPGFFLCPNRFTCAPLGGVCCKGAHSCNGGTFCDVFVRGACIGPGSPRFCPGSGNVRAGMGLHCPVGKTCIGGNRCV
jgi:hypothetical protein